MNLDNTKKRLLSTTALLGLLFAPSALADSDVAATGVSAAAVIEQRESYALRLMTQIYDGVQDFSHTQMLGFGRVRKGNRSLTQFDFGDGAVVLDRPEGLAASRFVNMTPVEMAVVYNYDTKKIAGDSEIATFHNQYVHPWLGKGPALGNDATWQVEIPVAGFGVIGAEGTDVEITLSREYFRHDGKDMVLVHYSIPSFRYDLHGRQVIQWGRGISLTDPSFSKIYLNSALHRSVVMSNGGPGSPLRYARTMVAANPDGSAMVDYRDVEQLAPYIDQFFSAAAMRVVPSVDAIARRDDRPIALAKNIDLVALSIGEDGANDVPITAGAQASPNRGQEVMTMQEMQALAQQQAAAQQDANALNQTIQQTRLDTQKTQLEMQKTQRDTQTKIAEADFASSSSGGSEATRGQTTTGGSANLQGQLENAFGSSLDGIDGAANSPADASNIYADDVASGTNNGLALPRSPSADVIAEEAAHATTGNHSTQSQNGSDTNSSFPGATRGQTSSSLSAEQRIQLENRFDGSSPRIIDPVFSQDEAKEKGAASITGGTSTLESFGNAPELELQADEPAHAEQGWESPQANGDGAEVGITQFGGSEIAAEDVSGARAEGGSFPSGNPLPPAPDLELKVEEAVDNALGGRSGQDVFDLPSDEFNNGGGFEISPETMEQIERSRAQGGDPAQQAFDRVRGGGDDVAFGGQDPNQNQGGLVQQTGQLYAGSAGASVGSLVDKAIALYGRPDKFIAAASAISDLQQLQRDLTAEFDALEFAANNVAYKARTIPNKLSAISKEIKTL
ncbi:MAG: hypothetical protein AAGC77_12250, partial [Pseudomonadota bacterium]